MSIPVRTCLCQFDLWLGLCLKMEISIIGNSQIKNQFYFKIYFVTLWFRNENVFSHKKNVVSGVTPFPRHWAHSKQNSEKSDSYR